MPIAQKFPFAFVLMPLMCEFTGIISILSRIAPAIAKQDTHMRSAISPRLRLQIALRYLSGPASFTVLEDIFRVPKPTLSKIIPEVCEALWQELNQEFITLPQDQASWLAKAKEFSEKWQYPFALAAMDGKHVEVQAFQNSGIFLQETFAFDTALQ